VTYDSLIHASCLVYTGRGNVTSQQDKAVNKAARIEVFTLPIPQVAVQNKRSTGSPYTFVVQQWFEASQNDAGAKQ